MSRSVALLSGGMDSCVLAALLKKADGADNVHTVSFNYRQRHASELRAASDIAAWLGVSHQQIILPGVFEGAGSTLIEIGAKQPRMSYEELRSSSGVLPTYVPFRNAVFISIATALALTLGADIVAIATHAEDARNWAYPDCTPEFNGGMASAVYVGTYHKVRLLVPFQYMTKVDILRAGFGVGAPLHLTQSCYEGAERACGECPTCVERIHAFQEVKVIDPIPYRGSIDWDGCIPYVEPEQ